MTKWVLGQKYSLVVYQEVVQPINVADTDIPPHPTGIIRAQTWKDLSMAMAK